MNNYQPYNYQPSGWGSSMQAEMSLDQRVSQVMKKVYVKMFLGLLVTAAVSVFVALFHTDLAIYMIRNQWLYWGLGIAEIALVLVISARIDRMQASTATMLFYLFAIVNGLTLSIICLAFSFASLFKTFLICAGTFGAMSIYGYFTQKDLTKIGSFLMMALFGLIIMVIVNIFWANSTLDWIISAVGVLIFIGLTAWDTQQVKRMAMNSYGVSASKIATIGALSLYLDFINLFIYLLRFFGNNND